MKKLIFLLALLIPLTSFGSNVFFKDKNGKIGAPVECTVDTNIDVAFSTTVAVDALAGQKVIGFTAVTNLVAGDTVLIDADNSGPRKEVCVVDSIATLDVTCVDNLEFAHTAVQADDIVLTNRLGPLNRGGVYMIQLVTSANAAQAGSWVSGDKYVSGAATYGVTTASTVGQPGWIMKTSGDALYISFVTQTANAVAKACQVR